MTRGTANSRRSSSSIKWSVGKAPSDTQRRFAHRVWHSPLAPSPFRTDPKCTRPAFQRPLLLVRRTLMPPSLSCSSLTRPHPGAPPLPSMGGIPVQHGTGSALKANLHLHCCDIGWAAITNLFQLWRTFLEYGNFTDHIIRFVGVKRESLQSS